MASIRKKDTRPERVLRSALWRAGVRGWRCHVQRLPGTPDVAFSRWKVAVHVDGVWWHGRPDYFTHWGGAFKYAASVIGLPIGSYPESRPPQAKLPEQARIDIRAAYSRFGLIDD